MPEEEGARRAEGAGAPADPDAALLERLRRGDEDAFRALVEEHGPFLMRLVMMHVPSRAIAEEVVQDTWLAALNGLDRFEGRSMLRTWLASIALNKARTRGTREGRILPFALLRRRYEEGEARRWTRIASRASAGNARVGGPARRWPGRTRRPSWRRTRRAMCC